MESFVEQYINEWNRRNPNDSFANLVKAEVTTDGGVNLYLPIYVGSVLHKEKLMQTLSRGQSFISVENALKNFFDTYPKYSKFKFVTREVDPSEYDTEPILFAQALRSADENGFHLPRGYYIVDKLPNKVSDAMPNTPPTTTIAKPKIGIGWILLGIVVGGIVLYKIAKK